MLWFGWNLLIFKDPLYFAFGPYSAHTQQAHLEQAGELSTKGDLLLSTRVYLHALMYNSYTLPIILAALGALALWTDSKLDPFVRLSTLALVTPLAFNILALHLGHSVLFVQGISGNTWFNIRYGMMLMPSLAVFIGYLINRLHSFRWVVIGLTSFVIVFAFANADAVTIDDGVYGSSQKNVTQVAGYLAAKATTEPGFILISAASHDAIIFSSSLPMKRFIHEGTGAYWESATSAPDRWARWIIMRTHDDNDASWRLTSRSTGLDKYALIEHYEFADIYELKPEYLPELNTKPIFTNQK